LILSDDLQRVDGAAHIEYTNNDPAALSDIYLWLYPNLLGGAMSVTNLRLDGAPATPTLWQNGALLRLPLPAPLPPGGRLTLRMDFTVTVPTTPVSNYGILSLMDGVLALAHAYPMLAVYDENGWRIAPPSPYGDIVHADAADYDVTIHAPAGWVLAASGEETLTLSADGRQTLHVQIGPARDFYLAASPNYDILSQEASGVQINVYAPAAQRPRAANALSAAARALERFSARYGPYPYPELDIVVTPNFALGIEYPGIIALTNRLLTDELSPLYLESTVVHEVAHQWFYNLVGNDQVNEPWLDESLSQFATWQYYTDLTGSEANPYHDTFTARWAAVDNEPIPIGQPVAAYDGAAYSAIIYGRGALFLIELRQRMGVTAFDAFLRDYTTTYAWGIANTSGFRALAEQHCACNLTSLFEAWVLP
ncbi:MAG: M1 family metallopeptidase, partial [Anaerolineales bacterium]